MTEADRQGAAVRGIENIPLLYDAMSSIYDWLGFGRWRKAVVEGAQGRTLDIGCGTGRNLPLYPPGVRVIGLDLNPDALQRARSRSPSVPLVRASAEQLPFRAGSFDTVVSGLVFCSVRDPARGFGEVKRVLRASGQLRMLEHVRAQGQLAARLQDAIQPIWTWITGGCHPNRDTERAVEQAGFAIEDRERRARKNMRRFSARPS